MNSSELLKLVRASESTILNELDVLAILRNPFCTVEIANLVADRRDLLHLHAVRERLAGFPGLPFSRAMSLITTLPWTSLLALAQSPRTPPLVRRQTERRIQQRLQQMTLGEMIALARRAHRPLLGNLIATGDEMILTALLDNPFLVENDVVVLVNTTSVPVGLFSALARHHRWARAYRVRQAVAASSDAPLPIALSALVGLRPGDVARIAGRIDVPAPIREAASALKEKQDLGLRR